MYIFYETLKRGYREILQYNNFEKLSIFMLYLNYVESVKF